MERDRKEIERRADRLRGRERQTERNGTRKRRGRERESASDRWIETEGDFYHCTALCNRT